LSDLEAALEAVHEGLPGRWRVRPETYDPGRHCVVPTGAGDVGAAYVEGFLRAPLTRTNGL
jgi:hypothetical protein